MKIIEIKKNLPFLHPGLSGGMIVSCIFIIFLLHIISIKAALVVGTAFLLFLGFSLVYTIFVYCVSKHRRLIFYKCYDRSVCNEWDAIMNYYVAGYMKKGQHLFATTELTWLDKSRMGPKATKTSYRYNANKMLEDCKKLGIKIKKLYVYKNSSVIALENGDANLFRLSLPHFQPNVFITTYNLSYFDADALLEKMK